ncbi:MAG TPA: hypothetical protein VK879_14195 [Candidatus Sulfomarinibacteraceae bacterium]|nr:hypothetical protein [Candidatus Sulfomarinibacteraceae bacterium]
MTEQATRVKNGGATSWLKERWRDVAMWPLNLVRDTPVRLGRLLAVVAHGSPFIPLAPGQAPTRGRLVHAHCLATCLFDLLGGPEIAQYVMHLFMNTSPLRQREIEAIASVLGPRAIRYKDVRIAEGGILSLIFRLNGERAFCTWHTIHLPQQGRHTRENLSLLVHEATHVFQYERLGSAYIGEALHAQRKMGRGAYDYGGARGLQAVLRQGGAYGVFNREAQAQIAQDYYRKRREGADVTLYKPFISMLRSARF